MISRPYTPNQRERTGSEQRVYTLEERAISDAGFLVIFMAFLICIIATVLGMSGANIWDARNETYRSRVNVICGALGIYYCFATVMSVLYIFTLEGVTPCSHTKELMFRPQRVDSHDILDEDPPEHRVVRVNRATISQGGVIITPITHENNRGETFEPRETGLSPPGKIYVLQSIISLLFVIIFFSLLYVGDEFGYTWAYKTAALSLLPQFANVLFSIGRYFYCVLSGATRPDYITGEFIPLSRACRCCFPPEDRGKWVMMFVDIFMGWGIFLSLPTLIVCEMVVILTYNSP